MHKAQDMATRLARQTPAILFYLGLLSSKLSLKGRSFHHEREDDGFFGLEMGPWQDQHGEDDRMCLRLGVQHAEVETRVPKALVLEHRLWRGPASDARLDKDRRRRS